MCMLCGRVVGSRFIATLVRVSDQAAAKIPKPQRSHRAQKQRVKIRLWSLCSLWPTLFHGVFAYEPMDPWVCRLKSSRRDDGTTGKSSLATLRQALQMMNSG